MEILLELTDGLIEVHLRKDFGVLEVTEVEWLVSSVRVEHLSIAVDDSVVWDRSPAIAVQFSACPLRELGHAEFASDDQAFPQKVRSRYP